MEWWGGQSPEEGVLDRLEKSYLLQLVIDRSGSGGMYPTPCLFLLVGS